MILAALISLSIDAAVARVATEDPLPLPQRVARLEQLERDLRGWPHDIGIATVGAALDMASTGLFRDNPERGLIESNELIGNGPGAAERHTAIKSIVLTATAAVCYELRRSSLPKQARWLAMSVGGGFAGLAVYNTLR